MSSIHEREQRKINELVWEKYFLGSYASGAYQIFKNTDQGRKIRHSWMVYHLGKVIVGRKTLKQAKEYCQEHNDKNINGDKS